MKEKECQMRIFTDEPHRQLIFEPGWIRLPRYSQGHYAVMQSEQELRLAQIHARRYLSETNFQRNIGWNYDATVTPLRQEGNVWVPSGASEFWEAIPQALLSPRQISIRFPEERNDEPYTTGVRQPVNPHRPLRHDSIAVLLE